MADGHFYKKIITTGVDKDATHIPFYAKATGFFMKIFGVAESKLLDATSNLSDVANAATARSNISAVGNNDDDYLLSIIAGFRFLSGN